MENEQIAENLEYIADLLELDEANAFKVRSYREAARSVRQHGARLSEMISQDEDLTDLPRVGDSIARDIEELVEKNTCERLEALKERQPAALPKLMKIRQLGPKTAEYLYRELGIESIDDLKEACEAHKIRELSGFGEKTEERLLRGIQDHAEAAGRFLRDVAQSKAASLSEYLESIDEIERHSIAGSFRRCKETVGDLDVLVQATDRKKALEAIMDHEAVESELSRGEEKASVRLSGGIRVDFRFFEEENFGAAMLYFTGSKEHSVRLRKRAKKNDWTLNEYGLFKGDHCLAAKTEEGIYKRLGLAWIPPELREDRGELEAADDDDLPELVSLEDIRGDLHCHTRETDGKHSLRQMLDAAEDRGYDYVAITDHSQNVRVAEGMDEDRTEKHAERIRKAAAQRDILVLAGVEVDILEDGRLDLDEDVLQGLDWVVASIHSKFDLEEEAMTDRLLRAIESGVIHCIGHPFCRQIKHRGPIDFDVPRILKACAENDVFLEINANPERLDLPDTVCKQAKEAGVKMVISTDAHQKGGLRNMPFGVEVARRGWLTRDDVVNTFSKKKFRQAIRNQA